jgi:hypothetical protein
MATEVGQAYVTLIPSARGFSERMRSELENPIRRAGDSGGDTYGERFSSKARGAIGRNSGKTFEGLKKGLKVGLGAGLAAGGIAAIGVTALLKDSVSSASDLNETMSKAGQIFGQDAMPELEKFAQTASSSLGQTKQQAIDAASTFAIFGKSAGLSGKDLTGFATKFTGLASDLASFHNSSPQESIDAIGSALRGEAEPMRRFGVLMDDASLKAKAMDLGIVKASSDTDKIKVAQLRAANAQAKYTEAVKKHGEGSDEARNAEASLLSSQSALKKATDGTIKPLTAQQKVLAAQALIYDQTKDAQGDFARTSGGLANQQRIAAAEFDNAKTALGQGLLPVVTDLMKLTNKALPKITDFAQMIGDKLGPAFKDAFSPETVGKIKNIIDKITGFSDSIGVTGDGMTEWVDLFKQTWDTIVSVFESALDILRSIWQTFGEDIIKYVSNSLKNFRQIFGGILDIIKGVFDLVAALIHGDWAAVWEALKTILSGAWQALTGILKQALNVFQLVFKVGWTLLVGILKRVWSLIKLAVVAGIKAQISLIAGLAGKAVSALSTLGSKLASAFRTAWNAAKTAVVNGVTAVVNYVKGLPGKLLALGASFASAGKSIIGSFVSGLKGAAGLVSDIAGNIWNAVKGLLNSAIYRINRALEFHIDLPFGGGITVNPPDISPLAHGGRVTGGGVLALIGEGREPETVLPDSMLSGLLERTRAAAAQVGELTITNWAEGTGYFRLVATGEITDEVRFRRSLGAMHA